MSLGVYRRALSQYHEILSVFYSDAHIKDLLQDSTDQKYKDLDLIAQIAGNNYLCKYFGRPVMLYAVSPIDAFKHAEENPEFSTFSSEIIKIILEKPELKESIEKLKQTLSSIDPVKINLSSMPSVLQDYFRSFFDLKDEFNIEKLLSSGMTYYQTLNEDSKEYRKLRSYLISSKKTIFGKSQASIEEFDIDHLFMDSVFKSEFLSFIDNNIDKNVHEEYEIQYRRFLMAYSALNSMGLDSEKNKKSNFRRTFNDGLHALYASYCDIFVTNDKGIREKCKVVYRLFNVKTVILNSEEFSRVEIEIRS